MSENTNMLSIKVQVAGRIYPLTIRPEEEANIRKAASLINERIKIYEDSFTVNDRQDLIAMCALEQTVQRLEHADELKLIGEKMGELESSIPRF